MLFGKPFLLVYVINRLKHLSLINAEEFKFSWFVIPLNLAWTITKALLKDVCHISFIIIIILFSGENSLLY